jgi:hypothetical protein
METRKLLRHVKSPDGMGRSARVWRITKGVLKAETGMIRVRLYHKGKVMPTHIFPQPLCGDTAAADEMVRLWLRHGMPYTPRSVGFLRVTDAYY